MTAIHEGGCICGAVRFRVKDAPLRTSACHCRFCQRRTGSAFGIGAYFREPDVEMLGGALGAYEHRSDETQRWIRLQFCPRCGTTLTWTLEALPGMRAIAGGCFDDPTWFRIERHAWLRSAHPWVAVPAGVESLERGSLREPGKPR